MSTNLSVDDGFRRHLLPLDPKELAFLEESVISEGCREPLVIWKELGILVDGHHRYDICTRNKLPFKTIEMSFANREAALDWMDKNQVGRRNVSTKDMEIIRGRIYNRRKRAVPNQRGNNQHAEVGGQIGHQPKTCEAVAAELDTSPRTIRRSGQRAAVYDAMLEAGDMEAAEAARSITRDVIYEVHNKPVEEAAEELKAAAKEKAEPFRAAKKVTPPKREEPTEKPKKGAMMPGGDNRLTENFAITKADVSITQLKGIPKENEYRDQAFDRVIKWIKTQRGTK